MSTVGLRPLRVGEILDRGVNLYLNNAPKLMATAAPVVIPLQLLQAIVLLSVYDRGDDISVGFSSLFSHHAVSQAEANARLGASLISSLTTLIGTTIVAAACTKAASELYLGQPASVGGSLKLAVRRLPALLAMFVVQALWLALFFLLLVIPGIWLYTCLVAATPALLVERLGPVAALKRSKWLVKGHWRPTAGAQLMYVIITGMAAGAVSGGLTAIALTSSHPSLLLAVSLQAIASIVSGIAVQPLAASMVIVIYYDLRVRKEGFDLELLAEQLGFPAPAGAADAGAA